VDESEAIRFLTANAVAGVEFHR